MSSGIRKRGLSPGLAAALIGKNADALRKPTDPSLGSLLETFAANELTKQLSWSEVDARLFHYRETNGPEVDLILERRDGRVVAIEIKSTTSPRADDARGLLAFRRRLDAVGDDFVCGLILHTGERRITFHDRIHALPIADLWT